MVLNSSRDQDLVLQQWGHHRSSDTPWEWLPCYSEIVRSVGGRDVVYVQIETERDRLLCADRSTKRQWSSSHSPPLISLVVATGVADIACVAPYSIHYDSQTHHVAEQQSNTNCDNENNIHTSVKSDWMQAKQLLLYFTHTWYLV